MGETTQLEVYGSSDEVRDLGLRIKTFQDSKGNQLTELEAQRAAQYALAVDANPWRGEIYAYKDGKGKVHIVEGYKLLVRWARRQCPYTETYQMLTDEEKPDGSVGWRCWILREDSLDMLKQLKQADATFRQAYEIAATPAVGVVRKEEMTGYKQPPKGWTWDQVAKKRALKNALNKSHGAPSPREFAQQSWEVGTTQTERQDWVQVEELPSGVVERAAAASAQARERVYAEHERDTAIPRDRPTGSAVLFKTTKAQEATVTPSQVIDASTGEVVEAQTEEPAETKPEPVIDQHITGEEIMESTMVEIPDGGPPWPEELAPEEPPAETKVEEPADVDWPRLWPNFAKKAMNELGYGGVGDVAETLKANGYKEICKSDGVCAFDRAKAWSVLVGALS